MRESQALGISHLRLHSLPQSKQFPDVGVEYAELLHRSSLTLKQLFLSSGKNLSEPLLLVTSSASGSSDPTPRDQWLERLVPSALLCSVRTDYDPTDSEEIWAHMYIREVQRDDIQLTSALILVADEIAWGVMIAPASVDWVYMPYAGGADILGAPESVLADLRDSHPDWLPSPEATKWRSAVYPDTPGWEFRAADMPEATARRLAEVAEAEDLLLTNGIVVDPRKELTIGLGRSDAQLLRIILTNEPGEVYDYSVDQVIRLTPAEAANRLHCQTALDGDIDEFLTGYGYRHPVEAVNGAIPGRLWDPESDYTGIRDAEDSSS